MSAPIACPTRRVVLLLAAALFGLAWPAGAQAPAPANLVANGSFETPDVTSAQFATYAAGSRLAACGLVSGGGMTREAALAKLFALLGAGLEQAEAERWFAVDLCGEMA